MSMAGRELVASLRVNRLDTKVLVYLVRRRVAEGMPLDDVERAYEEAMAPFAEAWPPDDRPVPWEVIHAERRRLGPLRLPVTYRDLPRNPHQSGVVKPPPKDAVRHAHLAWTREAVRQRPGLWEADRLLPTDLPSPVEMVPDDAGDTYARAVERQRAASAPPKARRAPAKRKTPKEPASGERTAVGSASDPPVHDWQEQQPSASNRSVRLVDAYRRLLEKYGTDHPR